MISDAGHNADVSADDFLFLSTPTCCRHLVANHDDDVGKALELIAACGLQAKFPGAVRHLSLRRRRRWRLQQVRLLCLLRTSSSFSCTMVKVSFPIPPCDIAQATDIVGQHATPGDPYPHPQTYTLVSRPLPHHARLSLVVRMLRGTAMAQTKLH